jgi:hypothetical protein
MREKPCKKTRQIFLLSLLLFGISCNKQIDIKSDCLTEVLKQRGMVKYEKQEQSCRWFLELSIYKGQQYFRLGNHCADLKNNYPFDCAGNKLCEDYNSPDCVEFNKKAEYKGIVGIQIL